MIAIARMKAVSWWVRFWYWLTHEVVSFRVHAWDRGRLPTYILQLGKYLIAGPGWLGSCNPGLFVEWHKSRLLQITIRTGGKAWYWHPYEKRFYKHFKVLRETIFYIRLGQEVFSQWEQGKKEIAWCINWSSEHFVLWVEKVDRWLHWTGLTDYTESEGPGCMWCTARFGFIPFTGDVLMNEQAINRELMAILRGILDMFQSSPPRERLPLRKMITITPFSTTLTATPLQNLINGSIISKRL